MSLKNNIVYNGILTASLYILQFLTFPYVTRVLGVDNLGIYNFCNSYVTIFSLTSILGISTIGVREIAQFSTDKELLNQKFTSLFFLNLIFTLISIVLYVAIWFLSDNLRQYDKLMASGVVVLISNLFLVEWLFRGVEDFKYVTIRTLLLRCVYVISVFIFVRTRDDYDVYFYLSVALVATNAIINWGYKNRYAQLTKCHLVNIRGLIVSSIYIGGYLFLGSYSSNIFPVFLGTFFNNTQVGLFVTSSKLLLVILLLFNAYTVALIPRLSTYTKDGNNEHTQTIIYKSYRFLMLLIIPCVYFLGIYADEIVYIIAGAGYEDAARLMRLSLPILLLNGMNQINIQQVLLPYSNDGFIFYTHLLAVLLGIIINVCLSNYMEAESSVYAWWAIELILLIFTSKKVYTLLKISTLKYLPFTLRLVALFSPVLLLVYVNQIVPNPLVRLTLGLFFILLWIHIIYFFVMKDDLYKGILYDIKSKILK